MVSPLAFQPIPKPAAAAAPRPAGSAGPLLLGRIPVESLLREFVGAAQDRMRPMYSVLAGVPEGPSPLLDAARLTAEGAWGCQKPPAEALLAAWFGVSPTFMRHLVKSFEVSGNANANFTPFLRGAVLTHRGETCTKSTNHLPHPFVVLVDARTTVLHADGKERQACDGRACIRMATAAEVDELLEMIPGDRKVQLLGTLVMTALDNG